jgi:hypothetical protein
VKKAAAFAAGAILVRVLVIFLFAFILGSAADQTDADDSGLIASTLLTVLGLLMLIAAYKKFRKEEDPDAPPPKWMTALGGLAPLKAMGFGALFMGVAVKQWVFTLSAIAIVEEAQLGGVEALLAYVLFVLGSMSLVILPTLFAAVAPAKADQVLGKIMGVMERYNRPITVGVSLIFGLWFLYKGITGLIG